MFIFLNVWRIIPTWNWPTEIPMREAHLTQVPIHFSRGRKSIIWLCITRQINFSAGSQPDKLRWGEVLLDPRQGQQTAFNLGARVKHVVTTLPRFPLLRNVNKEGGLISEHLTNKYQLLCWYYALFLICVTRWQIRPDLQLRQRDSPGSPGGDIGLFRGHFLSLFQQNGISSISTKVRDS